MSPPSWAVWIEIYKVWERSMFDESPPSRAAWIEMRSGTAHQSRQMVAAFTGGVD